MHKPLRTIGSPKEPVVEERRETLLLQISAFQAGDIPVVFFPQGCRIPNASVKHTLICAPAIKEYDDCCGAGMYLYNERCISEDLLDIAVFSGNHHLLLGHIEPKRNLKDGKPLVVVQAAINGVAAQDSAIHADRAEEQLEMFQKRWPGAVVSIRDPDAVLKER